MFRTVPQLTVSNVKRSVEFYTKQLGFAVTLRDPEDAPVFVSLEREDATLFLVSEASRDDTDSAEDLAGNKHGVGIRLFFEVDDAKSFYDRARGRGATILRELSNNEEENYAEFVMLDPDGYEIGIYS